MFKILILGIEIKVWVQVQEPVAIISLTRMDLKS